jgi:hypothetical protein
MDNRDLIGRLSQHAAKKLGLEEWSFRQRAILAREVIHDLCHEGILGLFYKYTKKGNISLIVYNPSRLKMVLRQLSETLRLVDDGLRVSKTRGLTRRMLDILAYMGEITHSDDLVVPVVRQFEGNYRG